MKNIEAMHTTVTFDFERLMNCLGAMRDESVRAVNNPYATHDSRLAWYYCQLGAYDLAHQMGWITEKERRWFYDEMQRLAPIDPDQNAAQGPALELDDEEEDEDDLAQLMRDRANEMGVTVRL